MNCNSLSINGLRAAIKWPPLQVPEPPVQVLVPPGEVPEPPGEVPEPPGQVLAPPGQINLPPGRIHPSLGQINSPPRRIKPLPGQIKEPLLPVWSRMVDDARLPLTGGASRPRDRGFRADDHSKIGTGCRLNLNSDFEPRRNADNVEFAQERDWDRLGR